MKAADEHHFKLSGLPITVQETIQHFNFDEPHLMQAEVIQGGIVKLVADPKLFKRNRNTENLGKLQSEQLKKLLREDDQVHLYQTY